MSMTHDANSQAAASAIPNPVTLADDLSHMIAIELHRDQPTPELKALYPAPERLQREVESLSKLQISAWLSDWATRYGAVGARDPYLWTWCRRGVEITALPCVDRGLYDQVCDTKVLSVMMDVLLDDIADQGGDLQFLEALIEMVQTHRPRDWRRFSKQQRQYAEFTWQVAQEIRSRLESLPKYQDFKDLLAFDYSQLFNTMRYSHLLNRFPSLLNLAEHDLYLPHNMHMIASSTMDLMATHDFDTSELGHLREAIWHAQYMGRIGNLVTTWERELYEGDFTSGVFVRAVSMGDLSLEQLTKIDPETVKSTIREKGHEAYFLNRWYTHRRILVAMKPRIRSFDLSQLIEGLDRLICLHLASRGRK